MSTMAPTLVRSFPFVDVHVTRDDDSAPAYVQRAREGDARAFQELFRNHRRDVARLVGRLLGPKPEVEDVVQEVFIQVFRSLPNFRGDARFTTWLHRVTVNVTLMHLRAARSRPRLGNELLDEPAAPEGDSPVDHAARNQRLRALYKILDTLSDKKRAVFILHDLDGVPAAQIAAMVDSPVLTVRTRLFYARREVYAAMAGDPTLESIARELAASDPTSETVSPR
ncbi:MAG: RNA polymerase sigma factor [Myxococcaceae bacterium]|nr:MAG: RNA polymerase sigma factor [Myxococcaceae bacterium]